jgi:LemA protein
MLDFLAGLVTWLFLIVLVIGIIGFWGYNSLRKLAEDVKEAASNIKVAMGKKTQLVNDLTALVLRYHEDEKLTMLRVSEDLTVSAMQQTYQQTGAMLSAINGIAQRYPELKSNEQFGQLMASIQQAENGIQEMRMRFNNRAKEYNVRRGSFPHLIYSSLLGFSAAQYLDFDAFHAQSGQGAPLIADDGERMRELMGMAGSKALEAGRSLASHSRALAEKAVAKAQESRGALAAASAGEYTYLDAQQVPQGPVTRAELDALAANGTITPGTRVLRTGAREWVAYGRIGG